MLSEKEQKVLDLRNEGATYESIAKAFNCTRERIKQIERKALRKLEYQKKIEEYEKLSEFKERHCDEKENDSLERLDLSVRSYNCLLRAKITSIKELLSLDYVTFSTIKNLGRKSQKEIIECVHEQGLRFNAAFEIETRHLVSHRTPISLIKSNAGKYIRPLVAKTNTRCFIGQEKGKDNGSVCLSFKDEKKNVVFEIYGFKENNEHIPYFRVHDKEFALSTCALQDILNIMKCVADIKDSSISFEQLRKAIFNE